VFAQRLIAAWSFSLALDFAGLTLFELFFLFLFLGQFSLAFFVIVVRCCHDRGMKFDHSSTWRQCWPVKKKNLGPQSCNNTTPKPLRVSLCHFRRHQKGRLALKTKKSKPSNKSSLTAQPSWLMDPTFDARHGLAHFAHADKWRTVFTAGESKATAIDLHFSRFGCQKRS